jgi:hypothetical protein
LGCGVGTTADEAGGEDRHMAVGVATREKIDKEWGGFAHHTKTSR